MNLAEWKESGIQLIKALRVRGEEQAFRRLLSDLYPDTAHFIYELLQNAEDTRATQVNFKLNFDSLEFTHDGNLFVEGNVKAITSFGNTTKRDDPTSIGKFGVGFKAVFAYTNTPEIHSGDFHFRIHDLVVPETEGVTQAFSNRKFTLFRFPFNNPKKPGERAVNEIKEGLINLSHNSLLFLKYIRRIEYFLPNGDSGYLERSSSSNNRIVINVKKPGNEITESHWLHFEKHVEIQDEVIGEDGELRYEQKDCRIAIAYKLIREVNDRKASDFWKIVPLEENQTPAGQVSIYFPASEEKPNLRFHLHAPFASTVARDVVRKEDDVKANGKLRDCLAELVIESVIEVRNLGMLTMEFVKVLPNSKDTLENFYKPIRDAIINAFDTQPLLPTISGKYAPAEYLYRADKNITGTKDQPGLISQDDLRLLTNNDKAMWLANAPSSDRVNDFIEDTAVKVWNLQNIFTDSDKENLETWFVGKSDQWLLLFYELLNEKLITYLKTRNIKLIRVDSAGGDIHLPAHKVYFAPKENTGLLSKDIYFVKKSTYQKQGYEESNSKAEQALQSLGVKSYSEEAVIKLILKNNYSSPSNNSSENHIEDIRKFFLFWKKNPSSAEIFKPFYFLRSNIAGEIELQKSEKVCLDNPYVETGLSDFIDIHRKEAVWHGYAEKMEELNCTLNEFIRFLQDVGVFYKLEVAPLDEWYARWNPIIPSDWNYEEFPRRKTWSSPNRKAIDYSIIDLEKYLAKDKILASRLIWNALISAPNEAVRAEFALNRNHQISGESQLVKKLKEACWIPDKSGSFKKPCELTKDDLRDDFKYEIKANLLAAIGFGERAKDMRKEQDVLEYLEAKGTNVGELDEFLRFKKEHGVDIDYIRKCVVAKQKRKEFPKAPIDTVNPETLKQKIIQNSEDQPEKESVKIERSIQKDLPEAKAIAKAYLRGKYKNSDYELICQCCKDEMPFKIDEYHYFEAVQFIKNITKVYKENYLALCPTCAAKYKYARETTDDDMRRYLINIDSPDDSPSVDIPVRLAGEDLSIEFVGKHWFELKTILLHFTHDADLESLTLDLQPQNSQVP